MRIREELYLYAIGLLNLRRSDLWEITNGELADMITAHKYKSYLQRQERALNTVILANLWSKKKISVQDLTGFWYKGKIYDKNEFLDDRLGVRNEGTN